MGLLPARSSDAFLTALVAGLLLAVPATAALGQQGPPPYPPGQSQVACDRTVGTPGSPPFCRAGGFAPGSDVSVSVQGPRGAGNTNLSTIDVAGATTGGLVAAQQPRAGVIFSAVVQADAGGIAAATIQIPDDARNGVYDVTFSGISPDGSTHQATSTIRVTAAPAGAGRVTDAGTSRLPLTGLALFRWGVAVVLLIGAGLALVYVGRRRDTTAADAE